jgi:beta-N-acetylhexosaminidase
VSVSPKALIFGCSGLELTGEERYFFQQSNPLGFILFERNCQTPEQVKKLVADLESTVQHRPPILIDQEGGRVVRLKPPHWAALPASYAFGSLAQTNLGQALEQVHDVAVGVAEELKNLGITVNCAPCADLLLDGADPIIGDRAFSDQPEVVALLCGQVIRAFYDGGLTPVIKHLPGHGRAPVDSHKQLPVVNATYDELINTDFLAFQIICDSLGRGLPTPWGMTAHVVYSSIDSQFPATHSATVIQSVIRDHIGFDGFLISDCLTMDALCGSFEERSQKAIEAGCDAVLHCNGKMHEMVQVAVGTPPLSFESLRRLQSSIPFRLI